MAEREDLSWALLQSVQAQPSTSTLPGLTGHVQEACELGSLSSDSRGADVPDRGSGSCSGRVDSPGLKRGWPGKEAPFDFLHG